MGFTVLLGRFASATADARGTGQVDTWRRQRRETQAKLLNGTDRKNFKLVASTALKVGDGVLVEAGDVIPSDGEVIEGMASVNAAAITGESAPVIREAGGYPSAGTRGTHGLPAGIPGR